MNKSESSQGYLSKSRVRLRGAHKRWGLSNAMHPLQHPVALGLNRPSAGMVAGFRSHSQSTWRDLEQQPGVR